MNYLFHVTLVLNLYFLSIRFPNTACELLTSDVQQITDALAGTEELVIKLYSFLEGEKPLNPLLASFFSKVMGLLITRKSEMVRFSLGAISEKNVEKARGSALFITNTWVKGIRPTFHTMLH